VPGIDCDVAIAGGGPAGLAAALTLLRYTRRRVVVVESSEYDGFRIGETASPGLQPLLGYLGAWEGFLADRHRPALGTSAAWGSPALSSRDFLFTGRGTGWHLDRCRFDGTLARQVRAAGGTLLTGARVADCVRARDGRWQLAVAERAGGRSACSARFVIDAGGRASRLARRLGARRRGFDLLVGVAAVVELPAGGAGWHHTLIESCAAGWWYSAPLPAGRRAVAVLMTDSDLVRALRAGGAGEWRRLLAETGATRGRLAGSRPVFAPRILPAASQILEPAAGPGWIAAGDAAVSFDPLASAGVGHALVSGIHAARAAHEALEAAPQPTLLAGYGAQVARTMSDYLRLRHHFYAVEQRWPEQPFWQRRHLPPAAVTAGVGATAATSPAAGRIGGREPGNREAPRSAL
jgi:flavin-dependent dehydrogenase